ncbi:acyl carrier protein [Methylocapsa sp. S129]|uniref:acyl carrier protein n=1 Tax=Methylocapsa sp. S129 TaxID=1641869 RepID=UPI00131E8BFB|nr:acyl carrier protein [Methylocapsa sp. S129]
MTTRSIIISQIQQVAAEQKKTLAPLTDDLSLLDSGLDSLCFAILVARLEDAIGVDPFTASAEVKFPNTIGELIAFYEHVAA